MSRLSTTVNSGTGGARGLRPLPPPQLAAVLLGAAVLLIVVGLATHANVRAGSSSPSNGGIGLVFDVLVLAVVVGTLVVGYLAVRALMGERFHGRAPFQVTAVRPKWSWKERIAAVLIPAVLLGGAIAALCSPTSSVSHAVPFPPLPTSARKRPGCPSTSTGVWPRPPVAAQRP